ncbi:acyl-CoA dehydrogenase family protein [Actinomadura syzygii]|uniref:acyl-CoA dehydrogenase family protein n=1 Tax=Actinomadura syzygii TaxID=1427538 RepID=UPI001652765B|nr:acyl-CoA dehydrogenase family protein [Actinomadura syzygii]
MTTAPVPTQHVNAEHVNTQHVNTAHRPELRRNDYSLGEEQADVQAAFTELFTRECPTSRVREAEPLGHDEGLWRSLVRTGAATMGLPEALGGGGASPLDLALVAEAAGRHVAPVPLIEASVALRLLAVAAPDLARTWIGGALEDGRFPTLALHPVAPDGARQLVPAGAVTGAVIALTGEELALHDGEPAPLVENQGRAPVAWWQPSSGGRTVVAEGDRARVLYAAAVREWKLLTAAALSGIGEGALALGLDFVKDRTAFDTPIGAFQAISHALADAHTGVVGARNLARKAAWFAGSEPDARPELVPMAFAYAAQAATKAVTVATHVQGGFGFTVESDVQLYFRRAKGWSVLAGDPRAELSAIGDLLADRVKG